MWTALLIVKLLCFTQIFSKADGMHSKPDYEYYGRHKRSHTNLCVQIQPNGASTHEPYYMCQGPEFPARQLSAPSTFPNPIGDNSPSLHHPQAQNLQFGNTNQPNIQYLLPLIPPEIPHYSPPAGNSFHPLYHTAPAVPKNYIGTPSVIPAHSQNNYENSPQPNSCLTKSDILVRERNANYESPSPRAETHENIINVQQPSSKAAKHDMNSDQFRALLEDEILGAPNLAFSNDELLPIQNMYSEPKPEIPLLAPNLQIPAEYLNDPVLRTFYNIDRNRPPLAQQYNPVLPEPVRLEVNSNACPHSHTIIQHPVYLPPPELFTPNNCFDFPLNHPPVLIAVPWLISPPYQNVLANTQFTACGQGQNSQAIAGIYSHDHIESNLDRVSSVDNLYTQARVRNDNSSMEEMPIHTSAQPEVQTPTSSMDDLFVEDTTIAPKKVNTNVEERSSADTQDKKVEITAGPTKAPHTTIRSFKTMLHNARMHAMGLRGNNSPMQQVQHKRDVPHMDSGNEPSNIKKQYVTKLKKDIEM